MSDETSLNPEAVEEPAEAQANPSAAYEVEGEPGVYWCARHSKVTTRLRCGRCEKPICAKCTKYGPTGARCPDCASYKGTHMYQVAPQHYVAAAAVALVLGTVSGVIAQFAGLFTVFYAPVAGTLMGKAVSAVAKHKRGTPLAVIASAGLIVGALIPMLGTAFLMAKSVAEVPQVGEDAALPMFYAAAGNPFTLIILLVYLVLAIPSVWYWLK